MSSSKWRAQFDGKSLTSVRYVPRNRKKSNSLPSKRFGFSSKVIQVAFTPHLFTKELY